MKAELEEFFQNHKIKRNPYGGYGFKFENVSFNLTDKSLGGLSLVYSYIAERTATQPTEVILNSDTSSQELCAKIVDIVEMIKKN